MEDFKGTKGEWSLPHFADPNSKCKCGYVLCEQYCGSVATINYSNEGDDWRDGDFPPIEEAKYNAYLISAAPMLLFELQELVRICKANGIGVDSAEYAISKALGKEADNE